MDEIVLGDTDLLKGKAKNGLAVWIQRDLLGGKMTIPQKLAVEKLDKEITQKAEVRSSDCWVDGCGSLPTAWVREVQFDLSKPGTALTTASVSSSDYEGPIPGFCPKHVVSGPELLVKAVYLARPEVQWGYFPERAVLLFSDGMKTEFESVKFVAPHEIITQDIHTKGNDDQD